MASISFNPDRMEFLVSFTLDDMAENKNEEETLNLGQEQILMNISHVKDSLMASKILLPTPLPPGSHECMLMLKELQKRNKNHFR
jgi:hypothetical protein